MTNFPLIKKQISLGGSAYLNGCISNHLKWFTVFPLSSCLLGYSLGDPEETVIAVNWASSHPRSSLFSSFPLFPLERVSDESSLGYSALMGEIMCSSHGGWVYVNHQQLWSEEKLIAMEEWTAGSVRGVHFFSFFFMVVQWSHSCSSF